MTRHTHAILDTVRAALGSARAAAFVCAVIASQASGADAVDERTVDASAAA